MPIGGPFGWGPNNPSGAGGGADVGNQYIVLAAAADLTAERVLTAPAAGITLVDGGAGGALTITLANDLSALEGLGSTGIAVRSAADTWVQRTITGTANQITVTDGNGVAGNPTLSTPQNIHTGATPEFANIYLTGVFLYSDFTGFEQGTTDAVAEPFAIGASGTGAQVITVVIPDTTSYGVLQLETGTTTTGRANLGGSNATLLLGTGAAIFETRARFPTLSDDTEDYRFCAGFVDAQAADATDGVYFRYNDNVNAGEWEGVAVSNGVESTLDTNTLVSANTWYKLRVVVNAAGTSAEFFIDGSSVGTIATNIPTGAGRETGYGPTIRKTAGTTERTALLDYLYVSIVPTTAR